MAQFTLPTEIVHYPDPRLRKSCAQVVDFDETLSQLATRMYEIMARERGVGLAGPQVGVNLRLFACNPTGEPDDYRFYINPELQELVGQVESEEGCLSLPEITVNVRRARKAKLKARDLQGKIVEEEGSDLLARIWQHEIDHLDGKLIIDRMDDTDRLANKKQIVRLEEDFGRRTNNKFIA